MSSRLLGSGAVAPGKHLIIRIFHGWSEANKTAVFGAIQICLSL
jgi:hypothetical protein